MGNSIREYSEVTWDKSQQSMCSMWLLRLLCEAVDHETGLKIDVLNKDGDIIQEVNVTRDGFEYLRSRLKFRWENRDECQHDEQIARFRKGE
jgi:hypothetical protein